MASDNDTLVSGWQSSPDGRATYSIVLSCLVTIALCCWTSVCPNIPAISDSHWYQLKDKFDLACLGVLGPEFLLGIAVGQYVSARKAVKAFEEAGYSDWSVIHAFFADMGGFVLEATDLQDPIPLDAMQLLYLIQHMHVNYPKIPKADINDKSKVDGLARLLCILQALWFSASLVARPVQGLAVTTLELTTASFVIVMLGTSFFGVHKPSDISRPIILPCLSTIAGIRAEAGLTNSEAYQSTPLDFVGEEEFCLDSIWQFYIKVLRSIRIPLFSRPIHTRPHNRNRSDRFLNTELDMELVSFCFILAFCGSFLCAWNFSFPTLIERLFWRIASVYTLAFGTFGGIYVAIWHHEFSRAGLQKKTQPGDRLPRRSRTWLVRDFTSSGDAQLTRPKRFLIPVTLLCACYCLARGYILVEDVVGLRALPKSAYDTVDWSTYMPHF